ncbi:MAG: hypothetical protein ACYTFT_14095 [Planctomycetota bacterium]|jgi:hypothetical protein
MFRVTILAMFGAVALLLAVPRPSQATTVVLLGDAELVEGAERIVHGVVFGKEVRLAADGERTFTEYSIKVTELLKGEADREGGDVVTFREWGGRLATGEGLWIPGTGSLAVGEEVVVFLSPTDEKSGCTFTTGLAQGKFHVRQEPDGARRATRGLKELRFVDSAGTDVEAVNKIHNLASLKTRVRALVASRRTR